MPNVYKNHEFEALKCRFENQTEHLYRMTLIDLKIFFGYITLQLALGGWIALHGGVIPNVTAKIGLMIIDLALAVVAAALLFNNYKRRREVNEIVRNCNLALGYDAPGIYLEGKKLNVDTVFRAWAGWYFTGIAFSVLGMGLVLFWTVS